MGNQHTDRTRGVRIPLDTATIGIVRDFLTGRALDAEWRIEQQKQSKCVDPEAIEYAAWEIRISRLWQKMLVDSKSVAQTILNESQET